MGISHRHGSEALAATRAPERPASRVGMSWQLEGQQQGEETGKYGGEVRALHVKQHRERRWCGGVRQTSAGLVACVKLSAADLRRRSMAERRGEENEEEEEKEEQEFCGSQWIAEQKRAENVNGSVDSGRGAW